MALSFLWNCSKNTTSPKNDLGQVESYTTGNVKTEGTQYFTFASKKAVTRKPDEYDLAFDLEEREAEVGAPGSCEYFAISTDPVVKLGPGVTGVRLDASSLDDVTEIPQANQFVADDTLAEAVIGKSWFDAQNGYSVRPDVYVLKRCDGSYALVQFKHYDFDMTKMQISNIYFDFKLNGTGSTDFSQTALDSGQTGNGYEKTQYFSLKDGQLSMGYGTWDLKTIGSAIWLGPNVTMHKLENTDIDSVTTVSATDFTGDHLQKYLTMGWYDSDENHKVIPRDYAYIVKTKQGKIVAFALTNYYDDQGNSGAFTIQWKYLQ